jgi:hypothetical protein
MLITYALLPIAYLYRYSRVKLACAQEQPAEPLKESLQQGRSDTTLLLHHLAPGDRDQRVLRLTAHLRLVLCFAMLRRPATVVSLDNTDLAQFFARSEERLAARTAQAQHDLLARQQKQHERVQQQDLDMSAVSPRSGRRKKLRMENEAPSRGTSAASKSNTRHNAMLGQDSSMADLEQVSSANGGPRHDASPSVGRRGGRLQQYEPEDDAEEPDAQEGMDLDAGILDGELDLDADVPDMDNTANSDEEDEDNEEGESQVASTTIDTSGVDVDMSTPSAPARNTRTGAGGYGGSPIAGHTQSQHSSMTTTPSGPPPLDSTTRVAAAPRRTRGTQALQQPQQGNSRRMGGLDGTNNDYIPNYPSAQVSQLRQTTHGAPAQPEPQQRRRNGSPLPSNGASYNRGPRSHAAPPNSPPQPQDQHLPQQHAPQAATELNSRRRIQEETEAVRERERARRARMFGGQQAQAQTAAGRVPNGSGPSGMAAPPLPPNYGGVPGAPTRGAPGRTARR